MPKKLQNTVVMRPGKEATGPQTIYQNIVQREYANLGKDLWILDKVNPLTPQKIEEIRKHPTVSLVRQLVVAPVLAAHWSVEEKENEAPEGARDFIEKAITPFRHELLRTSLYGCIDYGWQAYEKVYALDPQNRLVINKLKPLVQPYSWILINNKGAYKGILQEAMNNQSQEVTLLGDKTLLTNFDVEGTDWYGTSVLEVTEGPYDEYKTVQDSTNKYDMKVAGSHWIVHYPPGQSDVEGNKVPNDVVAQQLLQTLESSGSLAVPRTLEEFLDELNEKSPNAWTIELLSDMSQTTSNFIQRLKYIDNLLVRTFGIPERAVLEGEHGTKAEAGTHTDAAIINMDMRHRTLVQVYNQWLVNRLLAFNYGPEYMNSVYIVPAPILDRTIQILQDVYDQILKNPQGFLDESEKIDTTAIKSQLGIPYFREDESERHQNEYSLHG